MGNNIFLEAENEIKNLIATEHFTEAYQLCLRLLDADPDSSKFYAYKNKIAGLIRFKNRSLIEQELKKTEELWQKNQYAELLEQFQKLMPFIEDYPELKDLIAKAQAGYRNQSAVNALKNYNSTHEAILALLEKQEFPQAQELLKQLFELKINLKKSANLQKKLCNLWIESELNNHQTLLNSNKFDDTILFFHKLLTIDPDSSKIKKMMSKTKKNREKFQIFERQDFIYKSLEQIRILFQLHKYKLVIQASKEILTIDPKNALAKSFSRKAKKADQHQTDELVIKQMLLNQKSIKELATNAPKTVVKI